MNCDCCGKEFEFGEYVWMEMDGEQFGKLSLEEVMALVGRDYFIRIPEEAKLILEPIKIP